jgi:beta-N-acetylhexosaminidase
VQVEADAGLKPMQEPAQLAGGLILRAVGGFAPSPAILDAIAGRRAAGVTIFRSRNVESPAQLRSLSASLQAARPNGDPPLLIATDQEGGQLQAIGDGATAWPGNLALAAAGSEELAERAASAIGRELAAMGVNVVYAPVCDLLSDGSALMGTRTVGDDPELAARMVAASVRGFATAGVAATLKHFPGHGAVVEDSHYVLPVARVDRATLGTRELVPFSAGIEAGADLVMLGHLAVPALTRSRDVPACFAPEIAEGLLRDEMGFAGVSMSDALDMGALGGPEDLPRNAVSIVAAGVDLLLTVHEPELVHQAIESVMAAVADGRLDMAAVRASASRVIDLRRRLGERVEIPSLDVVGCAEHAELAREIAERAVTLVRDRAGMVPLRPPASGRPVVVSPAPTDLTPADTSSYARLGLAEAFRGRGFAVDELETPMDPGPNELPALHDRLAQAPSLIIGTVDAVMHPGQARLVESLVVDGVPTIAVALRTPFDLAAYPSVQTFACTYGIQPPNLMALVDALTGRIPFRGQLPVRLDSALMEVAR